MTAAIASRHPSQVRALLGLRWRLVRSPRRRRLLAALLLCFPGALAATYAFGAALPGGEQSFEVRVLLPTLLTGFALFAFLTPLFAGGGGSLFPPDELAAFGVDERTHGWMGLLLVPINITWLVQVFTLAGVTGYAMADTGSEVTTALGIALWIGCCTLWGTAAAWGVVGLRQRRDGRVASGMVGLSVALGLAMLTMSGSVVDFLDGLPTRRLVSRLILRPGFDWGITIAALVAVLALGVVVLPRAAAWALTRASDRGGDRDARTHPRYGDSGVLWSLVRKDCLAAWRTPSLRRGIVTLGLLPLVLTTLTDVSWSALVLVPCLVAAGAVLLYGINAFCLDGTGAVWLASLPVQPRRLLEAKALSLALVTSVPVALAVAVGGVAVAEQPTATQIAAVLTAAASATALLVARGLRLSVGQPHRAQLLSPRDTPVPPGAMARASVALASRGTALALWLSFSLLQRDWWAPVVMAAPIAVLVLASWAGTLQRWRDPATRSAVLVTVAYG